MPEHALQTLRDVEGVQGSFVVSMDGELLCHDMPHYFDPGTLGEVGPRACRIFEAWSLDADESECLLRFVEHKLYMRGVAGNVLCALVSPEVHLPAIRTATQLVGRRIAGWLENQRRPAHSTESANDATARSTDHWAPEMRSPSPTTPTTGRGPMVPAHAPANAGARDTSSATAGREPAPSRPKRVRIYRGQRFEY